MGAGNGLDEALIRVSTMSRKRGCYSHGIGEGKVSSRLKAYTAVLSHNRRTPTTMLWSLFLPNKPSIAPPDAESQVVPVAKSKRHLVLLDFCEDPAASSIRL